MIYPPPIRRKNNPKFSVIIPAFNAESTIKNTLSSIIQQDDDLEIIIVDDGSTDNTTKVCHSFHQDNIIVVSQNNQGVSAARKTGIINAHGEYLLFVDADDTLPAHTFEVYRNLIENGCKLIIGNHSMSNQIKQTEILDIDKYRNEIIFPRHITGALWGKCFHHSIIKPEYFDISRKINHREDLLTNIRIAFNAKFQVQTTTKCVYNYTYIASGLSHSYIPNATYEQTFFNLIKSSIPSDLLEKHLITFMQNKTSSCIAMFQSSYKSIAHIKKSEFFKELYTELKQYPNLTTTSPGKLIYSYPYPLRFCHILKRRGINLFKNIVKYTIYRFNLVAR